VGGEQKDKSLLKGLGSPARSDGVPPVPSGLFSAALPIGGSDRAAHTGRVPGSGSGSGAGVGSHPGLVQPPGGKDHLNERTLVPVLGGKESLAALARAAGPGPLTVPLVSEAGSGAQHVSKRQLSLSRQGHAGHPAVLERSFGEDKQRRRAKAGGGANLSSFSSGSLHAYNHHASANTVGATSPYHSSNPNSPPHNHAGFGGTSHAEPANMNLLYSDSPLALVNTHTSLSMAIHAAQISRDFSSPLPLANAVGLNANGTGRGKTRAGNRDDGLGGHGTGGAGSFGSGIGGNGIGGGGQILHGAGGKAAISQHGANRLQVRAGKHLKAAGGKKEKGPPSSRGHRQV
jgi:hypothetical protein